jgi:uncharacterized membrane protein
LLPGEWRLKLRRIVLTLALRNPARHSGDQRLGCAARREENKVMRNLLLIVGFLALAIGLLWIGQGTGVIAWPRSSFMISQIQWAGYGAALAAVGLILIWQSKR